MFSIKILPRMLTASAIGLTFSAIGIDSVKATTSVGNVVTTTTDPAEINVCADSNLCSPGATISLDTSAPARVVKNDTGFAITDILYTIAPGEDAVWDAASSVSDVFEITIFANGTKMLLHNGEFGIDEVVFAERIAVPESTAINFSFTINSGVSVPDNSGVSIPKPGLIFGFVGLSLLGVSQKFSAPSAKGNNLQDRD